MIELIPFLLTNIACIAFGAWFFRPKVSADIKEERRRFANRILSTIPDHSMAFRFIGKDGEFLTNPNGESMFVERQHVQKIIDDILVVIRSECK